MESLLPICIYIVSKKRLNQASRSIRKVADGLLVVDFVFEFVKLMQEAMFHIDHLDFPDNLYLSW